MLIVGADPEGSVYTGGREPPARPVSRRGDRQGHVAEDDGPRRRRRVGARLRPRLVPDGAAARARGGAARRRLVRLDGVGRRSRSRARLGPEARRPDGVAGRRPLVPLEVLRRQLDDPVRLHGAHVADADGRRGAALQARRGDGAAGARHDRVDEEGRRRDRADAALRHLAAAGRAARDGGGADRHRRLDPGARACSTGSSRTPTR